MLRRFHLTTGLVASLVLTLLLAEGVWAGACAPVMERGAASAAMAHGDAHPSARDDGAPLRHSDHAPASHAGRGTEHRGERGTHTPMPCPLGHGAAMQNCGVTAPLPVFGAPAIAPAPQRAVVAVATETEPGILLGTDLFRPPKA